MRSYGGQPLAFTTAVVLVSVLTMAGLARADDTYSGTAGRDEIYFGYCDTCVDGAPGTLVCRIGHEPVQYTGTGILEIRGGGGNDHIEAVDSGERDGCQFGSFQSLPYSIVKILGEAGNDTLIGTIGTQYLEGGDHDDDLSGREGDDVLEGGPGNDVLYGGLGNDVLIGNGGNDELHGDPDDDDLSGQGGDDVLEGGPGDDFVYGGPENDYLIGNGESDHLYGNAGDDYLSGWEGVDYLYGGPGNDFLVGSQGDDHLYGGEDQDILVGATGDDEIDGGSGTDTFRCRLADPPRIYDRFSNDAGLAKFEAGEIDESQIEDHPPTDCGDTTPLANIEIDDRRDPYLEWAFMTTARNGVIHDHFTTSNPQLLLGDREAGASILMGPCGQPLATTHKQYANVCGPASLDIVMEYLGLSDPHRPAVGPRDLDGEPDAGTVDLGYHLSMEHIMYECYRREREEVESAYASRPEFMDSNGVLNAETFGSPRGSWYEIPYDLGNVTYDDTTDRASGRIESWVEHSPACGLTDFGETDRQLPWVADRFREGCVPEAYPVSISVGPGHSFASLEHLKAVVKGYIDHGIPLVLVIERGGHFNTLIGYWERADGFWIYTADPLDGWGRPFYGKPMRWRKIELVADVLPEGTGLLWGLILYGHGTSCCDWRLGLGVDALDKRERAWAYWLDRAFDRATLCGHIDYRGCDCARPERRPAGPPGPRFENLFLIGCGPCPTCFEGFCDPRVNSEGDRFLIWDREEEFAWSFDARVLGIGPEDGPIQAAARVGLKGEAPLFALSLPGADSVDGERADAGAVMFFDRRGRPVARIYGEVAGERLGLDMAVHGREVVVVSVRRLLRLEGSKVVGEMALPDELRANRGIRVAFTADRDGDLRPDILLGAPYASTGAAQEAGRLLVVGSHSGAVVDTQYGRSPGQHLGELVPGIDLEGPRPPS